MMYLPERYLRSRVFLVFMFLLSLGLCLSLFYPNLDAAFGIIDDHGTVDMLGSDGQLGLAEIPKLFTENEEFQVGKHPRFRPSFHLLRLLEIAAFGDSAWKYYLTRILLVAGFFFFIAYILLRALPVLEAVLLILISLCAPYWTDIICRLVATEVYAVFGLGLICFVLYRIGEGVRESAQIPLRLAILYGVPAFVTIGIKENFLFLMAPAAYLLWAQYRFGWKSRTLMWSNVMILLYGGITVGAVLYFNLVTRGPSSEANTLAQTSIWDLFVSVARILLAWKVYIPVLILVFFRAWSGSRKELKTFAFGTALLGVVLLSQVVIYSGHLPTGTRYDFPGMFLETVFLFLCLNLFHSLEPGPLPKMLVSGLMLLGLFTAKKPQEMVPYFLTVSHSNAHKTQAFQRKLDDIQAWAKEAPGEPIVLHSYNIWDYELIASVRRYLTYRDITNPVFLRLHYDQSEFKDPVTQLFFQRLLVASQGGNTDGQWRFVNFALLNESQACLAIEIRQETASHCSNSVSVSN